jgi:hypothetical protein
LFEQDQSILSRSIYSIKIKLFQQDQLPPNSAFSVWWLLSIRREYTIATRRL